MTTTAGCLSKKDKINSGYGGENDTERNNGSADEINQIGIIADGGNDIRRDTGLSKAKNKGLKVNVNVVEQ